MMNKINNHLNRNPPAMLLTFLVELWFYKQEKTDYIIDMLRRKYRNVKIISNDKYSTCVFSVVTLKTSKTKMFYLCQIIKNELEGEEGCLVKCMFNRKQFRINKDIIDEQN